VTLLPGYGKPPEAEVVKPAVQTASAPAAVDDGVTDRLFTALAVVMETEAVAALVSEVVDTEVVADPVVVGLVTPLRVTDSWSPAFTER
jgi:hypothetical protein